VYFTTLKAATAANHRDGNNPNTLTSYIRKRRVELKSLGLNPNCMIAYTNRFADVKVKAQHRLQHFEAMQKWHVSGKTLPGEDNDDDDEEAFSTTALGLQQSKRSKASFADSGESIQCYS